MKTIYFCLIFFSSLLLADLNAIPLLNVGTTIYISDLFFIFFFSCLGVLLFLGRPILLNRYFILLLIVLFLNILYGMTKFGFRSIGEARYIYWLFFAFIPIFFYHSGSFKTIESFDMFFKFTYKIIVINILFLFVLELINGGRIFIAAQNDELNGLEDSVRGKRYLGSEDTFHLGVFAVYLFINEYLSLKKNWKNILIASLITLIIFFTKNRAALGSIMFGLICVLLVEAKIKTLLKIGFSIAGIFIFGLVFFPNVVNDLLTPFYSAINIKEDETGNWRLLVQAVAIEKGLQSPVIGQGFGGYFDYYVPEMNQTFNFPPHSIYVLLFQKCGIIGLSAYVMALIAIIRDVILLKKFSINTPLAEKYRQVLFVLFLAQIPYGFAYGFSIYVGLYIGLLAVLRKIITTSQPSIKTIQLLN